MNIDEFAESILLNLPYVPNDQQVQLVRSLRDARIPVVLLAPTGRAAKVFSRFSGMTATTIHRRIYRSDGTGLGYMTGDVADNALSGAVFIVDEASMIGGSQTTADGGRNLLEDLIQ